ncbi:hypothetical protein [Lentilactobacillus kosonis]|uniref:Uncharacterized protein n=1 Tax=Lentilactobacillus kosonis TaxID=2810561 RepID=A0A401FPG7_9LACO|nr:hypothetical protein [Lentilactobacillus kosonis]GAY74254.1 hypothetical protein NBRC111893_2400 [Lentilactobacillus kosonis]
MDKVKVPQKYADWLEDMIDYYYASFDVHDHDKFSLVKKQIVLLKVLGQYVEFANPYRLLDNWLVNNFDIAVEAILFGYENSEAIYGYRLPNGQYVDGSRSDVPIKNLNSLNSLQFDTSDEFRSLTNEQIGILSLYVKGEVVEEDDD